MTQRHIQRAWAEHLRTGKARMQRPAGRHANPEPTEQEILSVLDVHDHKPEGMARTATRLHKKGRGIIHHKTCGIMKSEGPVVDSPAESSSTGRSGTTSHAPTKCGMTAGTP